MREYTIHLRTTDDPKDVLSDLQRKIAEIDAVKLASLPQGHTLNTPYSPNLMVIVRHS